MSNPHRGRPLTSQGFSSDRVRAWSKRPETRHVGLLWLALTVALIFFAFVPARIMGTPASPTKRAVEDTMTVFSLAAAPVAGLVWAVAIYSIVKWRRKGATGPSDEDGPPMRGSRSPATVIWLLLTSLLCVFMLVWGLAEIQKVNASASSAPHPFVVDVTGQQWVWTFRYPQEGNIESDQLYLPVNRPVQFYVRSEDVIHSFWVVQLGIKVDANPGETTKTSVFPDRIGRYDIRCAELCGLLHADMETYAHVVSASDLDHWIAANGGHVS